MIVNKTVCIPEDMEFIYRRAERKPKLRQHQIISLLVDLLVLFWAARLFLRACEYGIKNVPFTVWFVVILTLILSVNSIYRFAARRKRDLRKVIENMKKKSETRIFSFGDDSVEVLNRTEETENRTKYIYDNLSRLYVKSDRLYAVMKLKDCDVYFPVHDDGYTEGSKEELIALIESRGIRSEEI